MWNRRGIKLHSHNKRGRGGREGGSTLSPPEQTSSVPPSEHLINTLSVLQKGMGPFTLGTHTAGGHTNTFSQDDMMSWAAALAPITLIHTAIKLVICMLSCRWGVEFILEVVLLWCSGLNWNQWGGCCHGVGHQCSAGVSFHRDNFLNRELYGSVLSEWSDVQLYSFILWLFVLNPSNY